MVYPTPVVKCGLSLGDASFGHSTSVVAVSAKASPRG